MNSIDIDHANVLIDKSIVWLKSTVRTNMTDHDWVFFKDVYEQSHHTGRPNSSLDDVWHALVCDFYFWDTKLSLEDKNKVLSQALIKTSRDNLWTNDSCSQSLLDISKRLANMVQASLQYHINDLVPDHFEKFSFQSIFPLLEKKTCKLNQDNQTEYHQEVFFNMIVGRLEASITPEQDFNDWLNVLVEKNDKILNQKKTIKIAKEQEESLSRLQKHHTLKQKFKG